MNDDYLGTAKIHVKKHGQAAIWKMIPSPYRFYVCPDYQR